MTDCIISFSKCVKLIVNRMGNTVLFIESAVPPEADNCDAELIRCAAKIMFCLIPRRPPDAIAPKPASTQSVVWQTNFDNDSGIDQDRGCGLGRDLSSGNGMNSWLSFGGNMILPSFQSAFA